MLIYPNGIDDTSAINTALAGNRSVLLAAGSFIISAPIILSPSGNNLIGNGKELTTITANRMTGDAFSMILNHRAVYGGSSEPTYRLEGFGVYANGQNLTTLTEDNKTKYAWGIYLLVAHYCNIRDVMVYDTGLRGIGVQSSTGVLIDSCHVENSGHIPYVNKTDLLWNIKADGNGISLNSCRDSRIVNCSTKNTRDLGITAWECYNSVIENCTADGNMTAVATTNTRGGFSIESTSENCIIQDCVASNNSGAAVQISSVYSIARRISINNHSGWAMATATGVHNTHFADITVNGAISGSNGFLIGQASDSQTNTRVTIQDCTLNSISASVGYGMQLNKIVSGFVKNCVINMADGTQTGIGYFWDGSASAVIIDSNNINGKSNFGYELNNVTGVVAKNSTINGTKNASFQLSNADGMLIDNNMCQTDPVSGQVPYMSVRMDAAASSINCTISNNVFNNTTRQDAPLGIYDQDGASAPILINNT